MSMVSGFTTWIGPAVGQPFLTGIGNNAHIFDGFAPRITDQFRVLALTRRGHGESDDPENGYDIDTSAEEIRLFLDHLNNDQAILVQHSNEGIELPHFAALYPERIHKLVFLEPPWDRNSVEFKTMLESWLAIDREVAYPEKFYGNFQDFIVYNNKKYPTNAASWCQARKEDLHQQMTVDPDGKFVYKPGLGISKARETMFGYTPEFSKIHAPVLSLFSSVIARPAFLAGRGNLSVSQYAIAWPCNSWHGTERSSLGQFTRLVVQPLSD